MRTVCFLHYIHLPVALVTLLTVLAEPAFDQQISYVADSSRMSLGSTWTRHSHSDSRASTSQHQICHGPRVNRPFFGGVTIGRGFTPFYYPYVIGATPWGYPELLYPPILATGPFGFHFSVNHSEIGSLFGRFAPV
ncbi:MAG: hypothetical protein MK102_11435, partial [Fuerstiella sp.]|nr:hypothetical protein [Fuerstiella sp.]